MPMASPLPMCLTVQPKYMWSENSSKPSWVQAQMEHNPEKIYPGVYTSVSPRRTPDYCTPQTLQLTDKKLSTLLNTSYVEMLSQGTSQIFGHSYGWVSSKQTLRSLL